MMQSEHYKNYTYGSVRPSSPIDHENGTSLKDSKRDTIGRRNKDGLSELASIRHGQQEVTRGGWWENLKHSVGEWFSKDNIVTVILWVIILVLIALVITRIVHVQQQKHGH